MLWSSTWRRAAGRTLAGGLVLLLAQNCACYTSQRTGMPMQRAIDVRELYRDPDFGLEMLERDKVTILASRLSFGHETLGLALGQGLVETMQGRVGDAVLHPNVAVNRINEAELAEYYGLMMSSYDKTNILDGRTLRKISEAVEVRYFAVPVLVNFSEDLATRFSIFGVRLAKTASANARFQMQIWDGHTGRIVWEGLSDLTLGQETIREERIRFDDTIRATWEALVEQIPFANDTPED